MTSSVKISEEARPLRSSGTLQRRRTRLPWDSADFRMLSIDGGGIRGILPAAILAECERRFLHGASAGPYFDLIAGTSTGGIIALALSVGIPASRILSIYCDHGDEIFPTSAGKYKVIQAIQYRYRTARNLVKPKYNRTSLTDHLSAVLGDRLYGDAQTRLVIPSFDKEGEVNVFKTPHHPDYKLDWALPMVDVALSTSAAPSFFPAHAYDRTHFMDGGVWANNPIMLGVIDILACNDINPEQIFCLTLGCGKTDSPVSEKQLSGGIFHWRTIFERASDLVSQNAMGQAGLLTGRDNLLRLDVDLINEVKLDDYAKALSLLPSLAVELVDGNEDALGKYFTTKRVPYKSYNGSRAHTR